MTATSSPTRMAALALAASLLGSVSAFANGGDFFEELNATWGAANNPDEGVPYFGFIKDTKGKLIGSVTVSATTASGSSFVVQSDSMGHYKIPGFSKSVDPKRVQITCSKAGYKLFTRDRRIMLSAPKAPIETNCVLAPDTSKPTA